MAVFPFLYTVDIYNGFLGKEEFQKGITFGETFSEAAEKIEAYYGDELISMEMEPQEEQEIWEFTSDSK